MIIVILVLGILMTVWGIKRELDKPIVGMVFQFIGAVVSLASIVVVVLLLGCVVDRVGIDKKFAMYEEENTGIEQKITDVVKQYQEYESGIFKDIAPEGAITLVTLYPGLKSDTLTQSQIEVYIENNKEIKELKNMIVNVSFYRWWLYFGK